MTRQAKARTWHGTHVTALHCCISEIRVDDPLLHVVGGHNCSNAGGEVTNCASPPLHEDAVGHKVGAARTCSMSIEVQNTLLQDPHAWAICNTSARGTHRQSRRP
jgi:hypothetical protein